MCPSSTNPASTPWCWGASERKIELSGNGLGFTSETVRKYLSKLGVPTCGHDNFIPENIFYRLAMKAKNTAAEGQDFYSILSESTGGRPAQDAILSIDLGKVFSE